MNKNNCGCKGMLNIENEKAFLYKRVILYSTVIMTSTAKCNYI